MFNKAAIKVKFQDQQLDDYVLENSVLKSKLQSKVDALCIMSKELDKCSMERDKYKVLVEHLKSKKVVSSKIAENNNAYRFTPTNTISNGDMFAQTKDHNNMLKVEVEMLRSKLEEAAGDILVLRKQLQNTRPCKGYDNKDICNDTTYTAVDYERLVNDLEKMKKKYQQIQLDYRATLDEKEELVSDRDYYKNKVQRLNHQISYLLSNRSNLPTGEGESAAPSPIVDIEALIAENKYLHERITQLQIENELIKRNLSKYKTLLDNRSRNYSVHLKKGFADVMTQKQVKEFLENNLKSNSKHNSAAELKSVCLGLFEALNDKSTALQHQRKTNQILASRLTELEKTLEAWCNGQKCIPIFPSQMLLDEFIPETSSTKSDDSKSQEHTPEDNNRFSDSDEESQHNGDEQNSDALSNECKGATKTVLPKELEDLVREALAELKPSQ
ncbi:coiled-coil domain-containing protein 149 isoform X1 [Bombyx mori]|uniref:Coiled-coil domain-containing protein 149 n=1 Tax=Bombyx mori TaxID=7091 RepID=A0A8R2APR5_BOMMO|nr:coiled-coil domain-containing protein 149 [Bombyx mori]